MVINCADVTCNLPAKERIADFVQWSNKEAISAVEYQVEREALSKNKCNASKQTDYYIRFPRERLHIPVRADTLPDYARYFANERDHPEYYPERVPASQVKWINSMLFPPPKLPRTAEKCRKLLTQWVAAKEIFPAEMHQRFDKFTRNLYFRRLVAVHPSDIGRCGSVLVHYDMVPGADR